MTEKSSESKESEEHGRKIQGKIFLEQNSLRNLHHRLVSCESDVIEFENTSLSGKGNDHIEKNKIQLENSQNTAQDESKMGLNCDDIIINPSYELSINIDSKSPKSAFNNSLLQPKDTISEKNSSLLHRQKHARNTNRQIEKSLSASMQQKRKNLVDIFWQGLTILRFKRLFMQSVERNRDKKRITPLHFQLIGDKTYQYNEFVQDNEEQSNSAENLSKGQSKQKIIICLSNILQLLPLLLPNQKCKIIWDCFYQLLIVYRMFIVTIKLSFYLVDLSAATDMIQGLEAIIILTAFFFDVLLNLKTGFYDCGQIVTDQAQIIRNYCKHFFLRDLFSQVPMVVVFFITPQSAYIFILFSFFCEWLIFLQYSSLKRVYTRVERALMEIPAIAIYQPIVNLYLQILVMCHVLALIYHLLAVYEIHILGYYNTWLNIQDIAEEVWYIKYLRAYYWAGCTVINILLYVPESNLEILFGVMTIFFTFWVFGNTINAVDEFRRQTGEREREIYAERRLINTFISKRSIGGSLKERIQMYLEYKHQEGLERTQQEEESVLRRLSPQLQREVLQVIYAETVQSFSFLGYFSQEVQQETVLIIHQELYQPGAVIFHEGEVGECCVYIIKKGVVELLMINKSLRCLKENEEFGLEQFILGGKRNFTVRAKEVCTVVKIKRQDFQSIVEASHDDYERFCELRDDLMHHSSSSKISISCYICGSESHSHTDCTEIKFVPQMKTLIYQYNHMNNQIRSPHNRNPDRTINARMAREEVLQTVEEVHDADDSQIEQGIAIIQKFAAQGISSSMILEALDQSEEELNGNFVTIPEKEYQGSDLLKCESIIEINNEKVSDQNLLDKKDIISEEDSDSNSYQSKTQTSQQNQSEERKSGQELKDTDIMELAPKQNKQVQFECNTKKQNVKSSQYLRQCSRSQTHKIMSNSLENTNTDQSYLDVQEQIKKADTFQQYKVSIQDSRSINESLQELLPSNKISSQACTRESICSVNLNRRSSRFMPVEHQLSEEAKKIAQQRKNIRESSILKTKDHFPNKIFTPQIPDKNYILKNFNKILTNNTSKYQQILRQRHNSELMLNALAMPELTSSIDNFYLCQPQLKIVEKAATATKRSVCKIETKNSLSCFNIDQLYRRRLSIMKNRMRDITQQSQDSQSAAKAQSQLQAIDFDFEQTRSQQSDQLIQIVEKQNKKKSIANKRKLQYLQNIPRHSLISQSSEFQMKRAVLNYIQENFDHFKNFKCYKPLQNYQVVIDQIMAQRKQEQQKKVYSLKILEAKNSK